jgi:hypothetical protein
MKNKMTTTSITQTPSGRLSIFCATAGVATLAIGAIAFHHIGAFSSFDQINAIIMMGCGGAGIVLATALYKLSPSSDKSKQIFQFRNTLDESSMKLFDNNRESHFCDTGTVVQVNGKPRKIFRMPLLRTNIYEAWGSKHLEKGMYIIFDVKGKSVSDVFYNRPVKEDYLVVEKDLHGHTHCYPMKNEEFNTEDFVDFGNPKYYEPIGIEFLTGQP